jgi:hypothetical protein
MRSLCRLLFLSVSPLLSLTAAVGASALLGLAAPAHAEIIMLRGAMNAAQVVDGGGSTSAATGFATLVLNTGAATGGYDADSMTLDFNWTGLSGPSDRSHMHDAPVGVSRTVADPFDRFFDEVFFSSNPVRTVDCSAWATYYTLCVPESGALHFVRGIADDVDTDPSCDPLTHICSLDTILQMARTDNIYLDMHTQRYPSAEIRGQLFLVQTVVQTVSEPPLWALLVCPGVWLLGQRPAARRARRRALHTPA